LSITIQSIKAIHLVNTLSVIFGSCFIIDFKSCNGRTIIKKTILQLYSDVANWNCRLVSFFSSTSGTGFKSKCLGSINVCLPTFCAFLMFKSHNHPNYNSMYVIMELNNAIYCFFHLELYLEALFSSTNDLINSVNRMEGYRQVAQLHLHISTSTTYPGKIP